MNKFTVLRVISKLKKLAKSQFNSKRNHLVRQIRELIDVSKEYDVRLWNGSYWSYQTVTFNYEGVFTSDDEYIPFDGMSQLELEKLLDDISLEKEVVA